MALKKTTTLSRRAFLLSAGAGGLATAAAIVTKNAVAPAAAPGKDKRATRGYHASAHINNYYRTTKV